MFHGSFNNVLRKFQRCLKIVSSVLLHVSHRSYPSRSRACFFKNRRKSMSLSLNFQFTNWQRLTLHFRSNYQRVSKTTILEIQKMILLRRRKLFWFWTTLIWKWGTTISRIVLPGNFRLLKWYKRMETRQKIEVHCEKGFSIKKKTFKTRETTYELLKLSCVLILTFSKGKGLTEIYEGDSKTTLAWGDDALKGFKERSRRMDMISVTIVSNKSKYLLTSLKAHEDRIHAGERYSGEHCDYQLKDKNRMGLHRKSFHECFLLM